jgi:phage tail-like protein
MAALGALGLRLDPPLACNFLITFVDSSSLLAGFKSVGLSAITDAAVGGFTECSGIEMTLDIEDYSEGGRNGNTLKFPTRTKWTNLSLKKGVSPTLDLWSWHYDFIEGRGKRRDGVISLLNELHVPSHIWYFRRGLPLKYTGPTLQAERSAVAIESIEIAHEGIYQVPFVGLGSAVATAGLNEALA